MCVALFSIVTLELMVRGRMRINKVFGSKPEDVDGRELILKTAGAKRG
jgi:hypothetical protein